MSPKQNELLLQELMDVWRVILRGRKLSLAHSVRIIPLLEKELKSILSVTDVEIVLGIEDVDSLDEEVIDDEVLPQQAS